MPGCLDVERLHGSVWSAWMEVTGREIGEPFRVLPFMLILRLLRPCKWLLSATTACRLDGRELVAGWL